MRNKNRNLESVRPVVLGTGLLALDVVVNGDVERPQMLAAGGTCGNVLINLAFLGWRSYPVARLADDWAGAHIEQDMKKWDVKKNFLHMDPPAPTPIIIHRIFRQVNGEVSHSFSWRCPCCKRRLPSYRPVILQAIQDPKLGSIRPDVFFFDRPSPAALKMAANTRENGALVVFELAGEGTPEGLRQALEVAHVVKYSEERAPRVPNLDREAPFIQVKTLGAQGLSFRCNLGNYKERRWVNMEPYSLPEVKDTAGAGDWCTSGLIDRLGAFGIATLSSLGQNSLREAFQYSQALAAINCTFEGARGSMYSLSQEQLIERAKSLLKQERLPNVRLRARRQILRKPGPCPTCGMEQTAD